MHLTANTKKLLAWMEGKEAVELDRESRSLIWKVADRQNPWARKFNTFSIGTMGVYAFGEVLRLGLITLVSGKKLETGSTYRKA